MPINQVYPVKEKEDANAKMDMHTNSIVDFTHTKKRSIKDIQDANQKKVYRTNNDTSKYLCHLAGIQVD